MNDMKRILVVDDSTTNLKFVEGVLKDEYKLTLVKSGAQALKFLENNTPDLILLDIMMFLHFPRLFLQKKKCLRKNIGRL